LLTLGDLELCSIALDQKEGLLSGSTEIIPCQTNHNVRIGIDKPNEVFEESETADARSYAAISGSVAS